MPHPYKYIFLSIVFCSWVLLSKGQDRENTYESGFSNSRYEISVENGDTLYSLIPEIWDLRPVTENKDRNNKETSAITGKSSVYGGGYMDLSHIPESYAVDKSKDIGEIAINQSSANGALGYSVPIEAYKAPNGVNPNIQLVYNSMSGNGIAGYGWQIGGLSVIAAVNSNYYFDGKPAPAKGDVSGAFVLDGQRLIDLKTGNSSEKYFQTEQGFIKVTAYLTGTIIRYFNVYYPNGSVATYGYEGNYSKKVLYPLTKVKDISGNIINYTYTETYNVYYVSEINYGGREGSNPISNYAKISFSYENRSDYVTSYIDGLGISQNKRLKGINTYFNGQLLFTYNLTYTNAVSSMLTQIECSSNGKSLNPLRFYYGENNQLAGFYKNSQILTSYFNNASAPDLILTKGKFNSYSYDDGLISYPNFNTYGIIAKKKNIFGTVIAWQYGSTYSPDQSLLVYPDLPSGFTSIPTSLTTESGFLLLSVMDVDGDGKDELVKMNSSHVGSSGETITYKVYDLETYLGYSSCTLRFSFTGNYGQVTNWSDLYSPIRKAVLTGDFLGNGKQTILTINYNKTIRDKTVPSWATLVDFDSRSKSALFDKVCFSLDLTDQVFVMDFDGDGKADICRKTLGSTRIYTFDLNTGYLVEIASYGPINTNNRQMLFGDVNGDGMTDITISPEQESGNTWTVYYSTGTGFTTQTMTSASYGADTKFILQDMNGDGKPDLVVNNNGTLQIYPNTNGRLTNTPESQTINLTGGAQAFLIPGNTETGYKMSQLFSIYNHALDAITFNRNLSTEQLLTGVVTSTGIVNKHQYASILLNNYNSIYHKGTTCTYPYRGLSGNVYLHAYSESFLSGNSIAATSAKYTRGMIDLRGKGFLGFEQVQVRDEKRNTTTTQVFNPVNFGTLTSIDSPAASATFSYNISVATNKIAKITLYKKTETDKLANTSVTSTYSYDSYGNPVYENKNYGNGLTVTTNSSYHNDNTGTPYKLGLLYQQITTSS